MTQPGTRKLLWMDAGAQAPEGRDGFDAYSPAEVARRVETAGVAKAQLALLPLAMLGVVAGAFIGLGAMLSIVVRADPDLGFAATQFGSGLAFSLGLLLVVVAGAELFTGNNLLVMAWADGRIGTRELLRNWAVVALANFAGAAGLAVLVALSGHVRLADGLVADEVIRVASAKQALPLAEAFMRGMLCNVLVCAAVWMAMAGRSIADKAVAVVFPITAFVAAGFEHSIANMYLFPLALMLQGTFAQPGLVTAAGMAANLGAVLAGNLIGGSVLVGLTYHVIYRRKGRRAA